MKSIRLSLRNKLLAVILLAIVVPLAVGFAFVIHRDIGSFRADMIERMLVVARVTGENSVSDMAFSDEEESRRTLAKLASLPDIDGVYLFDANGKLFSSYSRNRDETAPPPTLQPTREFIGNRLFVTEPIEYEGVPYGTICVVGSRTPLDEKIRDHVGGLLAIMGLIMACSVVLAFRFEKVISRPILALTSVAREISQSHDYSKRVERTTGDEIGVLSDGFNDMLEQIERRRRERDAADRRSHEKSQFLAKMSHELRTPLNAIIGFSEILQSRAGSRLDERERKFIDNIHTSGEHLLGIVNDILDLSKVEAGRMEMNVERFAIRDAIEGVTTLMRGFSRQKNIEFVINLQEPMPLIEADPVKVKQILYNLLSNAVKFSPPGSVIQVDARMLEAGRSPLSHDSVELAVTDQGIGIDPGDHKRIFEEFQQGEGTWSGAIAGTGLGLSLVKRFVEMHKGLVEVRSAKNEGSTFTIVLPLHLSHPVHEEAEETRGGNDRVVLVIEDDDVAYSRIMTQLRRAGFGTLRARTGEEGLLLSRTHNPDIITLDLILPGIDGWAVLKQLKAGERTQRIPVIIISIVENRELGMAFGADDYLIKPVVPEQLIDSIQRVSSRSSRRSLLVIDSDRSFHALLESQLSGHGFEITHAFAAAEGAQQALTDFPSVIVVDLMMQEMQGLETALKLRGDPRTARLPILAVTSDELAPGHRERIEGRIAALLPKSGDPSTLVEAIYGLIGPGISQ